MKFGYDVGPLFYAGDSWRRELYYISSKGKSKCKVYRCYADGHFQTDCDGGCVNGHPKYTSNQDAKEAASYHAATHG